LEDSLDLDQIVERNFPTSIEMQNRDFIKTKLSNIPSSPNLIFLDEEERKVSEK
jgi:hypothetical protein